jgi:hypothetical protein
MAHGIDFTTWIDEQLAGAPAELAERTREFIAQASPTDPAGLASAAEQALLRAIATSPDRRAALDLLAADALVSLALAACVEVDPAGFERFAIAIRDRHGAGA